MTTPRSIARYHDFLSYVVVSAPDDFPAEDYLQPEEQMTLDKAFSELLGELPAVRSLVKDEQRMAVLRELLRMSQEAYRSGDAARGAHILQEFEGLVWPKHKLPTRFEQEAVARVNGRQGSVGT